MLALLLSLLPSPAPPAERVVVLVPVRAEAGVWDTAYLAAIPAAAHLGAGVPVALAVDAAAPWRPELLDFLRRWEPQRTIWVGPAPAAPPDGRALERVEADDPAAAAAALALLAWNEAETVVLVDPQDAALALAAAALAARLDAPLLPAPASGLAPAVAAALERLGAKRAVRLGPTAAGGLKGETLGDAAAVVRWMTRQRLPVDYLAAVNPDEGVAGRARHLALAAPLLAAGRRGAVAPLPVATVWKRKHDAPEELGSTPEGAAPSSAGWRRGALGVEGAAFPFVIGRDPRDGRWWFQPDRDGDGAFHREDEAPVRTGEVVELGGRRWTADLDADESLRGQAVWLCSPTPDELRAELALYAEAARRPPGTLCLVGWPDALPSAVVAHGQGIDADLVTDLPFAQLDDDPFLELDFARFLTEDLPSATLLACRGFVRDAMPDQSWRDRFATAEWEGVCRDPLEGAGLRFAGHHEGGAPIAAGSPLAEAELVVHGSHAMWTVLGATYTWDSGVLLAPALVESAGCSTASIDQDPERRSVAARLLRNGAVAFAGNTRRGIAQQDLYRSELWNALLGGATLGRANREALNRVTVAVLEKGQTGGGPYYYQLHNQTVYGDPGLQLGLRREGAEAPARAEVRGRRVRVTGPEKWHRYAYAPLEEWGCTIPTLHSWRAAGVAVESRWYDPEKRNAEELFLTVEARTRRPATTVEPVGELPAPLGWTGACFVDEHADGSRSLWFRVRLLDADMASGEVREQFERQDFLLGSG